MKLTVGIILASLILADPAIAAPGLQARTGPQRHHHDRSSAYALREPVTTGSLAGSTGHVRVPRDLQRRDFRSSTRGNAQFPERSPVQQNLGNTSGGPEF
ncbi:MULTISPECIES: hypothetical protein [Methylobacterium]|jgi:hypothetical protein|uniref:Uncharacterized protein n=2 Tax=Methylobacterium TaxID=407 RepID=A0A2R4WUI5_9HYPH|nr:MULTISPECIES: hypothetical protein [Methylobacterium]AWB25207.1 hypothetical protein DA075_30150 [Methylobacterium currus]AWB25923.1 hypothetical protein DA075_34560 [Methylobacterium currus]TGD95182.1 hypothetical protein EU555_29145 [Methylobacterium nonmethylotrophicum]